MGTMNYLVDHKNKKIFELGKGLWAYDIARCKTPKELHEYVKETILEGHYAADDKEGWASSIADDIINTIGFGAEGMTDSNDEFHDMCSDYVLVGTIYNDKSEVGITLATARRY